jgi:hypothetical protein
VASAEILHGQSDDTKKKMLKHLICGSYYISGCQLGSLLQDINGSPLLSNSELSVASKLKKIPEEQCLTKITLQYTVAISHLIRD